MRIVEKASKGCINFCLPENYAGCHLAELVGVPHIFWSTHVNIHAEVTMKQKGITLVELIVTVAIVCIGATVVTAALNCSETQCINGYVFTNDVRHPVQIMDSEGHGIRCHK